MQTRVHKTPANPTTTTTRPTVRHTQSLPIAAMHCRVCFGAALAQYASGTRPISRTRRTAAARLRAPYRNRPPMVGSTKIRGVNRRERPRSERPVGVRARRLDVQTSRSLTTSDPTDFGTSLASRRVRTQPAGAPPAIASSGLSALHFPLSSRFRPAAYGSFSGIPLASSGSRGSALPAPGRLGARVRSVETPAPPRNLPVPPSSQG